MNDARIQYWRETLTAAVDDLYSHPMSHSLYVPAWAIDRIAADLAVSAENEGTAFGRDAIPNPLTSEVADLKAALTKERERGDRLADADRRAEQWELRAEDWRDQYRALCREMGRSL